ncbi:anti-sigma factor family protein [Pyxidicoccus sp. 3LFB2]
MRCIDESLFMKLLLGELSPEQTTEVDAHLDSCAACRQLVAQGCARRTRRRSPSPAREAGAPPAREELPRDAPLEEGHGPVGALPRAGGARRGRHGRRLQRV